MPSAPIDQLSIALDAAERILLAVRDDQWDDSTPCTDWQVRGVVNPMVVGNDLFARIVRHEPPATARAMPGTGSDFLSAYRDSAAALLDAFRQPGALQEAVTVPVGTVPGIVALMR